MLWNAGEKGRKPGRLAVPQQRITVRSDGMGTAPVIPLIYLTLLSAKLLAMAFPDGCTDAELSGYNDERTMAALTDRVMTVLEQLALRDGEEEAVHTFYEKVARSLTLEGSYLILLAQDAYDVPFRGKDGGALEKAEKIENYFGTGAISGAELVKRGVEQAKELGADIFEEEVFSLGWNGDYTVSCSEDNIVSTDVIIATG